MVLSLNVGGLEQVVLRLVERTDRSRFAPIVCALDEEGALAHHLGRIGVPLHLVPRRPGIDLDVARRLADLFVREGVRIVHTHNPTPHLYGALGAAISRRRKGSGLGYQPRVVHTKHGQNAPNSWRKVLVNRMASVFTDRVVAVGMDTRSVAAFIEHIPEKKLVTILNGIDTDEFRPASDPAPARRMLGIPTGGFHIGCVARLVLGKDHRTLLEAFARFHRQHPQAHLTLVGSGEARASLELRCTELDVRDAVTFAGVRSDIAMVLTAFDVFALASISEGISLTLLEAAAVGLPIVATRAGGNAEVVVDGKTGVLVPKRDPFLLAEALAAVASMTDRKGMGARGRARVIERFSVERMVSAYEGLYDQLLGASTAEPRSSLAMQGSDAPG